MKVLLVNGSPHQKGCTYTALSEVAEALHNEGIESAAVSDASSVQRNRNASLKTR